MNWGKGFFRVWIVVSVIYAAIVVGFATITWPTGLTYKHSPSTNQYEWLPQSRQEHREDIGEHLIATVLFGVGGPTALLVTGLAVAWIVKGFRANS